MDISVIIPIYNVEEYLVDCLESVRRNITGLRAEVLLIDDGSTDHSPIIARLYAEKLDSFSYYRTENGGLSRTRNYGASLAKGKYLFFIDSDDMMADGILGKMLETAERNGTELTVCNVARYQDKKTRESFLHLRAFHGLRETVSHVTKQPGLIYDSTSWNKLILRSFFSRLGISFPEGYIYEDMLPNFIMHYYCNGVSIIRETGYLWRSRTGSNKQITQINNRETLADKMEMMARTLTYAREHAASPGIMEALEIKFLSYDFDGWLERLRLLPEDEAGEYVELMKDFYERHIDKEFAEKLPLIKQQVWQDILQGDLAHLLMVLNYKNANYSRAPVIENGDNLELRLPANIFTIESRSAVHEFGNFILPDCIVNSVTASGHKFYLQGRLFLRRVSIPFNGAVYFKAALLNETTGSMLPLPVTPVRKQDLTELQGRVLNYDDYSYCQYDYDGAGFLIDIDFAELTRNSYFYGKNYIILSYDFRHCRGEWLLKGITGNAKKTAERLAYGDGEHTGIITFDAQNIICIALGRKQNKKPENPGTDILRRIPPAFTGTTAGKQLVKLQKDNKALQMDNRKFEKEIRTLRKSKEELDKIKSSNGYKVLRMYYKARNFFFK